MELVGFKVLRFHDNEVLNDIDNVIRIIKHWANVRRKEFHLPPPNPRQRGKDSQDFNQGTGAG